jgi:hypothetical protein
MSGYASAGPLRAYVKVANYCDPSFTGTLTCVKSLEMFVRVLATVFEQFIIVDRFFFFW